MSVGRLRLLAAEIRRDAGVLDRVSATVAQGTEEVRRQPDSRPLCAVLAVDLHRWYTGFEAVLERVERFFELMPSGPEWHGELLSSALLDVVGVRPPLVDPAREPGLRDLLRFRHFFRHAYVVELDAAKLLAVSASHAAAASGATSDLLRFADLMDAMAEQLPT